MAKKRRRTLSRDPIQRFRMWDAKVKGDIYATQLEAIKPLARDRVLEYQVTHEYLIRLVREVLAKYGKDFQIMQEYMWYASKLWRLTQVYKSSALQLEADAWFMYYLIRGRDEQILREIASRLGINISDIKTILLRAGVTVMSVVTFVDSTPVITVTNTTLAKLGEVTTTKQYLDPETIDVVFNNPSGSGVTLYLVLRILYSDGTESDFKNITIAEGVSDKYSILSEDIYENIEDDKQIQGIRVYGYVSSTPNSGFEPTVQVIVKGKEYG